MDRSSRRTFLADVSRGMLIAGVGYGTAVDLGLTRACAAEAEAAAAARRAEQESAPLQSPIQLPIKQ